MWVVLMLSGYSMKSKEFPFAIYKEGNIEVCGIAVLDNFSCTYFGNCNFELR